MPTIPALSVFGANGAGAALPSVGQIRPQGRPAGEATMAAGAAASQAGNALQGIALDMQQQIDTTRISAAMNDAMAAKLRLTHDKDLGYTRLQGEAALQRPDNKALDQEYADRLKEATDGISERLGNDRQRQQFAQMAGQMSAQFRGEVTAHAGREYRQFEASTQAGTVRVAQDQMAMDYSNPDSVAQGRNAIKAATVELGRINGWSAAETTAKMIENLSPAHAAVVAGAVQGRQLDFARGYLATINAELTPETRLRLQGQLKAGDVALQASRKADEIWMSAGPGPNRNAAVDLFGMEKIAREAYPEDPEKAKAAIGELRERAQAFNSSQAEFGAANTNGVYGLLDKGMSLSMVKASTAWQQLPEKQQRAIMQDLENRAYTQESRAAARASRAASESARSLSEMQRADKMLELRNGDQYMRAGDPAVLGGMSRPQVEALRPTFGLDATQHLLSKWDGLQAKGGRLKADMDKQDFDQVALDFGLRPFDPKKSEDERAALGTLQFRVERLIDMAQRNKKAELTREEKTELMRQEMARTVVVGNFFIDDRKPVVSLTPKEAARVRVPDADRPQIIEALRLGAERFPGDERYAPTEKNVRSMYLRKQSPSGDLVRQGR